MNIVVLMGRLTRNIEVRDAAVKVGRFTLAVPRVKKDESDFINCVAFGRTAEIMDKYLAKGNQVLVEGHMQTGSYTNKEGQKVYTTDVIVDRFEFCGSREFPNINMKVEEETADEGVPFV